MLKYNHESVGDFVENESFGYDWLQNPTRRLDAGEDRINLFLRGQSVDQSYILNFQNPGVIDPLESLLCVGAA
ncbi:MAG: hypothetical protein J0H49_09800 [Acidobacteria bacterium]|nr:hypothetical protein [Acidobacteriota bacterium]